MNIPEQQSMIGGYVRAGRSRAVNLAGGLAVAMLMAGNAAAQGAPEEPASPPAAVVTDSTPGTTPAAVGSETTAPQDAPGPDSTNASAPAEPAGTEPAPPPSAPPSAVVNDTITFSDLVDDPLGSAARLMSQPENGGVMAQRDLSPLGMFRNADIVVKLVMLGLIFASLVTWTILLAKSVELILARSRARAALKIVQAKVNLTDAVRGISKKSGPAAAMLHAARRESEISSTAIDHAGGAGLKERVSSALDQIVATEGRRAGIGTGILASIGATAPFVGLFGTVWGIMNSFIGIAEAQSSSLAVVAPGIAEALLATALGLVAAIPAVLIYNACTRWISGYRHSLAEIAAGVERLISRDLDFRCIPSRAETPAADLAAE